MVDNGPKPPNSSSDKSLKRVFLVRHALSEANIFWDTNPLEAPTAIHLVDSVLCEQGI